MFFDIFCGKSVEVDRNNDAIKNLFNSGSACHRNIQVNDVLWVSIVKTGW